MLLAVFLIGSIVGSTLAGLSDTVPGKPDVVEYSHSARIKVSIGDVPKGTDRVHIEAKELNDLTGDRFEEGYEYGWNPVIPYFYYPELNGGKYHVFRVKYGKASGAGVEWSQFSPESRYMHAEESRFSLDLMRRNWAMAKEQCISEGKRMAVIHGQKANAEVTKLLQAANIDSAWIGLYDEHYNDDNKRTTWNWVDNSLFKWAKFEFGAEKDASRLSSAVVAINAIGEWETRGPGEKLAFVCEKGVTEKPNQKEARVGLKEKDIQ